MSREKNDGRGRLGGRTKGTPNKKTTEMREWVKELIEGNTERFVECLDKLDPQEYVRVFLRLLNFVLPKKAPVKTDNETEDPFKDFMERIEGAD